MGFKRALRAARGGAVWQTGCVGAGCRCATDLRRGHPRSHVLFAAGPLPRTLLPPQAQRTTELSFIGDIGVEGGQVFVSMPCIQVRTRAVLDA